MKIHPSTDGVNKNSLQQKAHLVVEVVVESWTSNTLHQETVGGGDPATFLNHQVEHDGIPHMPTAPPHQPPCE